MMDHPHEPTICYQRLTLIRCGIHGFQLLAVSSQVSQCPSGRSDQAELAEGLSAEFDCCTKSYSKVRNFTVPTHFSLTRSEDL